MKLDGKLEVVVDEYRWGEGVGMVLEVEQEMSIWLAVAGVSD